MTKKHIQCEPLVARLDPLTHPPRSLSIECSIPNKQGTGLSLSVPFFTRLTLDAALSPANQERLIQELQTSGVAWLSSRKSDQRTIAEWADQNQSPSKRILPLSIDEPVDVDLFHDAAAVEMQLYGVPFQALPSWRRARWTPSLPIEIADFEQLTKKADAVRVLSQGLAPVGASICAGSVYEDVRLLADCGFDYFCLLTNIQHEFTPNANRELAPLESSVEQALKAIADSGTKSRLMLSANIVNADELYRWLQHGVSAVSLDAYLAAHKPADSTPVRESFGSVLSYAAPQVSSYAWVRSAISKLTTELQDLKSYTMR